MKRIGKIIYVLFCGILLMGHGIIYAAPKEKTAIKIGQITGFTNPVVSVYAVKLRAAAQMAVKEINDKGGLLGRNLELTVADDQSDTTITISHARRLKEKGVVALVAGPLSTEAIALGKWSMEEGHIPIIWAYAVTSRLNGHPWVFRPVNDIQSAQLMLIAMQKAGKTKVGILHTTLAYGIDAADRVEKYAPQYGIQIVGRQGLEFRSTDATVQAMKLREAGAEGLILCEYGVGIATFTKALNTIGWHPRFTSSWSNIYTALTMSSPPTLMDGAIPNSVCDRGSPRVKKVLADYAKFTGKEGDIDDPIMLGYSCVIIFAHAVREAKTADDPTAIRDALYKVRFKDLPMGRKDGILYFTAERNWLVPNEDHIFMEVKDGKLVPFKD
jgi:branched-chain amino acid transport system substrate-binding protein